MGGKSYFCDYCSCYMKNDINVRKVHNDGLTHKITKASYMKRYEDPKQVLEEERNKVPCTRFPKGYCRFGLYCQYSHYNEADLRKLMKIVEKLEKRSSKALARNRSQDHLLDWRQMLPWHSNFDQKTKKRRGKERKLMKRLPPSLKPINFNKIKEECLSIEWG